ncbi:dehydrogenase/reductase SDR family member on chromosome X [Nasonia vitripennis]|uniref:Uncharacterized protein n=1 Tax=Nasonia vitripennis TaxID=7425 RepID=A0A7M7R613_NASVI|nr:dehydrogenase/reductase SDR family member on chromosome X [Nasonia vitripennis]XP_031783811.1 dehydrogenase/reductase SDR family member on chromosome X [Nasonia vitripennis]XP_032458186.1 dehydrogenase/reductase SDR family member on chromosome X [Nasonia vitripennis]XP_032458187.1 dehydrogenase/reductase SDR family member on chromosome X [Nasonia vitripennis]XP_032458188.1 dehydrogenase/reductase SDR family member on chromosome X [Nasonia vitripennis]XP_032458189.1 dehydrogenase/reductase S
MLRSSCSATKSNESAARLRIDDLYLSFPKKRIRKDAGMLLFILGSTLAVLVGALALVNKKLLKIAMDSLQLHLKYNVVAVKDMFWDNVHAGSNKTELPKMPGRVAIVTGGSRGIGTEVVRMLLQSDVEVVIACRRTSAGEKAVESIRKCGVTSGKANVMELDNSSLDSVRKFVEEFKNNYQKLDILVNNAGIMFTPYGETKDGFEEQYGVNYLSHFLLTVLLIPLLKNAGTADCFARVVNVSSCAHLLGDINFEDVNHKGYFVTGAAYAQSKLAQLLFTKRLTRLFEKKKVHVVANAVHPGIVNTELFDHSYMKYFKLFRQLLFKSPTQGATPIVFAAVSPKIEGKSGMYIANCLDSPVNPLANDEALQDRLFEISLKQVKLQNVIV